MKIEIRATPRAGLRVIGDVPTFRLARLEGINGIGKSAAIRLLQICVGEQPYPQDDRLWQSFKENLGLARVSVSDLADGQQIVWELDPKEWPSTCAEPISAVGRILISGVEATLDDVAKLFRVQRIVGNEGLMPTLVRQFEPKRERLSQLVQADQPLRSRLERLDARFLEVQQELGKVTKPNLAQLARTVRNRREDTRRVRERHATLVARQKTIRNALDLGRRLEEVRNQSGDLDGRIEELARELKTAEAELRRLDADLTAAAAKGSVLPAAAHELKLAQRNAQRIGTRLEEVLLKCRAAASGLGITKEVQDTDATALRARLQVEITAARTQLQNVYAAPRIVAVSARLRAALTEAERDGLGTELIDLGDDGRPGLTITELRQRLESSAAVIAETQPTEQAEEIQRGLLLLEQRARQADEFAVLQAELAAETQRSGRAEERLATATAAVMASAGASVADITEQREILTARLRSLSVERSEAVRARQELGGGLSEGVLASRLQAALHELNLQSAALPAAAATIGAQLQEQSRDLTLAETAESAAVQEQKTDVDAATTAWASLCQDSRFAWLRTAVGKLPRADGDLAAAQDAARTLRLRVDRASQRAETVRRIPRELPGVLRALDNELAGRSVENKQAPSTLLDAARGWFGEEVSAWFRQKQVQSTLFGEASTDIRVDLAEMTVTWKIEGQPYSRPITAFSSGEQAFAYTRAQLALLDEASAIPNELIALDEFGSFMSRDWLGRLETYLRSRLEEHPTEWTLLVLPLTRTREELNRDPALAAELVAGYYVREVSERDDL